MNRLILHSTSLAQWYTLVNEAEDSYGQHLDSELESYLVHLLQHYTNKPELTASILAIDYLNGMEAQGQLRAEKLREVGDKSLLFSGFFPELANKRHVTVSYFVELGRGAYKYLALLHKNGLLTSKLYGLIRQHYVNLLDLLFSMRELSGEKPVLSLLQAEELWRNTRSQYAFKLLKDHNEKFISTQETFRDIH